MTPADVAVTGTAVRRGAVEGVLAFRSPVHHDDRGRFATALDVRDLAAAAGRPLFPVRQVSHSVSRRGVVRGIHYNRAHPGVEKLVHCPHGEVVDVVVDLRVGSPTFLRWEAFHLDAAADETVALYLPAGVGHAFVARRDGSVLAYLLSRHYVPEDECAVAVDSVSPDLPIPPEPVLSARDRAAPSVAQARRDGLLPRYRPPGGPVVRRWWR